MFWRLVESAIQSLKKSIQSSPYLAIFSLLWHVAFTARMPLIFRRILSRWLPKIRAKKPTTDFLVKHFWLLPKISLIFQHSHKMLWILIRKYRRLKNGFLLLNRFGPASPACLSLHVSIKQDKARTLIEIRNTLDLVKDFIYSTFCVYKVYQFPCKRIGEHHQ